MTPDVYRHRYLADHLPVRSKPTLFALSNSSIDLIHSLLQPKDLT